jgi:hypothetical protein
MTSLPFFTFLFLSNFFSKRQLRVKMIAIAIVARPQQHRISPTSLYLVMDVINVINAKATTRLVRELEASWILNLFSRCLGNATVE